MSKLVQNITNTPRSIKGLKPLAKWAYRSDIQLTLVDNKVTAVTAGILGVIEGCKFFMNAGGEQVVAEDNFSGFKQKFTAIINDGGEVLDGMDDIVLFVESNDGIKYVLGAKYGLWKTSQAAMANDNLSTTAVEFTSREGMEEISGDYYLIADIATIPTTEIYEAIEELKIAANGKVYLEVDSNKSCKVVLPDNSILTSTAGKIDTTWNGAAGRVKLIVPKDSELYDYSTSDFIDVSNQGLSQVTALIASIDSTSGVFNTNSETIFSDLSYETRMNLKAATTNNWTTNVLNYIPNLANVMHIGNSITLSVPFGGIWWGTWGMAASQADKDYVSVFNSKLNTDYDIIIDSKRLNISGWEANHATFDKSTLDSNFDGTEDFIVLKVGENVSSSPESLATFVADYVDLVQYIQDKSPNAKMVLCTSFWEGIYVNDTIINAAVALELPCVVLDTLDIPENKSSIGAEVYGDDAILHEITDAAVAAHPSDIGMAAIASLIHETKWKL